MHQKVKFNVLKKQKKHYSGKKKCHTRKFQIIIDEANKNIQNVRFSEGKKHDFALFKESNFLIPKNTVFLCDSGYIGMKDKFPNSIVPTKNTKFHKLSKEEKRKNRELSKRRVVVEHVFANLKRFKILYNTYRNRIKTFSIRCALICAVYNLKIKSKK